MAKFDVRQQQTRPSGTELNPSAMGAPGRALAQVGQSISGIGATIQKRQDTIERVRLLNQFDMDSVSEIEALSSTGDIRSTETVNAFSAGMSQRIDAALNQFKGSTAGREALRAQLENQKGQYMKSALGSQIKAQHEMIGTYVNQVTNELAAKALIAPDMIDELMTELDFSIQNVADAIPEGMEETYRNAGRATVIQSVVTGLQQKQNYDVADVILANPEYTKLMTADVSRKLIIDNAVGKADLAEQVAAKADRVQEWQLAMGRNLSSAEMMFVESLPDKPSNYTPAQNIQTYQMITGKPADQNVINSIMDISKQGGDSMTERAIDFLSEKALDYATGSLTPEDARKYQMLYGQLHKTQSHVNEMGHRVTTRPTTSTMIEEAFRRGNAIYGNVTPAAPATQAQAAPAAAPLPAEQQDAALTPTGEPAAAVATAMPAAQVQAPADPVPEQPVAEVAAQVDTGETRTLWDRSENIAGVVATIGSGVHQAPLIGGGEGTQQFHEDRQFATTQINTLIKALSVNPKYPVAEIERLRQEFDISGKFMDNPQAYRTRLIAINEALDVELGDLEKVINNKENPVEMIKAAIQSREDIGNFQKVMGVPPLIEKLEDVAKLEPGTIFRTPNRTQMTATEALINNIKAKSKKSGDE